jgi:hypothetical protein
MLGDAALPRRHPALPASRRHARAQELPARGSASGRIGVVFLAIAEADLLPVAAGYRVTWGRCGNAHDCRDEEAKQTEYPRSGKKVAIHRLVSCGFWLSRIISSVGRQKVSYRVVPILEEQFCSRATSIRLEVMLRTVYLKALLLLRG